MSPDDISTLVALPAINLCFTDPAVGMTVVQSRSHPSPELVGYLSTVKVSQAIEIGSALKFCLVAEGKPPLPLLGHHGMGHSGGPSCVEAAGGRVCTL